MVPKVFRLRWELRREPHTPAFKLSLRLLPALIADNDEDDDGNFTKWMSSYWGHGAGNDHAKDRRRSFRRSTCSTTDRRASLPCMSQLEAMQLKLHSGNTASAPVHLKSHKEKEVRTHPHARRVASDEYAQAKTGGTGYQRNTDPELSESFQRVLRLRNHRIMSLVRRLEQGARPRSGSSDACGSRKEVPFCIEQEEYHLPRQRFSLRRHR
ncbi:leukemia NUP98 fusion partner 1 [Trichomycterus rosablanca]|uniref:leukemia NUP98 fusion partner 1 n=1 Tax=Trichomycterus rosablanca TaxID=2290929 RepID=UPI002F35D0AC